MSTRRFQPQLWTTVFALPTLLMLIALGLWQLERLAWKLDVIGQREAALTAPAHDLGANPERLNLNFTRVRIVGRLLHEHEIHQVAPPRRGRLGYHILTPMIRDGATALVLVDRGWVPSDRKEAASRLEGSTDGPVVISGIARQPGRPGWFTPENEPDRNIWYWRDIQAIEAQRGIDLLPIIIEADGAPNRGGYPIGGQTRIVLPNNHLGYAITWFGLAVGLVAVYIAFHWRRRDRTQ
jgi:surfeit locus 1 family protein